MSGKKGAGKSPKVVHSVDQKGKIKQLMEVTGCSESQGIQFLTSASWSMEAAIGNFFESGVKPSGGGAKPAAPAPAVSKDKIESLFAKYEYLDEKGERSGVMGFDEQEKFWEALGFDPAVSV